MYVFYKNISFIVIAIPCEISGNGKYNEKKNKAKVEFSVDNPDATVTFECKLDRQRSQSCMFT